MGTDLADIAVGNSLHNRFEGRGGNDQLAGGMGDDTYAFVAHSALGTDILGVDPLDRDADGAQDDRATETADAEGGVDTLDFSDTTSNLSVALETGAVQVVNGFLSLDLNSSASFENLLGGSGADSLTGNDLANLIDGSAGDDTLSGRDGADLLLGGGGADQLRGNRGDDALEGGGGNDGLEGGLGQDTYSFDVGAQLGSDSVTEARNEGADTLDFSSTGLINLTVSLGSNSAQPRHANLTLTLSGADRIENLFGGAGDDTLTGNALDNTLGGGEGNDTLDGRAGTDVLDGGTGEDRYANGEILI
jgi:Ca2+-binding RTX toxin-like protein